MRISALVVTALVLSVATACAGDSQATSAARGTSPRARNADRTELPAEVEWRGRAADGAVPRPENGTLKPIAASWVAGGSQLQIIVWGSGSCPAAGASASVAVDGSEVVLVLRSYPASRSCTGDVRPTTSLVTLPDGVQAAKRVTVVVQTPAGFEWSLLLTS